MTNEQNVENEILQVAISGITSVNLYDHQKCQAYYAHQTLFNSILSCLHTSART